MKFIKEHKSLIAVVIICIVLLILVVTAINCMFLNSGDKYGNRLKNAPTIEQTNIDKIKTELTETKKTLNVKYETNAVTMKFFIDVNPEITIDDAKTLGNIILKNIDQKVLNFYDIEIYLTKNEGKDINFPAIGYHSKKANEFSWVINKGEKNEE